MEKRVNQFLEMKMLEWYFLFPGTWRTTPSLTLTVCTPLTPPSPFPPRWPSASVTNISPSVTPSSHPTLLALGSAPWTLTGRTCRKARWYFHCQGRGIDFFFYWFWQNFGVSYNALEICKIKHKGSTFELVLSGFRDIKKSQVIPLLSVDRVLRYSEYLMWTTTESSQSQSWKSWCWTCLESWKDPRTPAWRPPRTTSPTTPGLRWTGTETGQWREMSSSAQFSTTRNLVNF